MDAETSRTSVEEMLSRYTLGPAAATDAPREALKRLDDPHAVLVVEGVSDQIAVEAIARRLGIDLDQRRAAVVPIGGAHGLARGVGVIKARWPRARVGGLYDVAEEAVVRVGLTRYGVGNAADRGDLQGLGFWACDPDLEGELLSALGVEEAVVCIAANGDLAALRSLQRQPAWRTRPPADQLHRFVRSIARRNMRYALVLALAIPVERIPTSLSGAVGILDHA